MVFEDKITPVVEQGIVLNIALELGLLYNKVKENGNFEDGEVCGKVLFSLLNGLSKEKIWNMTDYELIQHIGKIQIIESR